VVINNPMSKLYLITDAMLPTKVLLSLYTEELLRGLGLFQLRLKDTGDGEFLQLAKEFSRRCQTVKTQLIINDRPDIALLVKAAGVHVGQDDLPVSAVRNLVGEKLTIGVSTRTPEMARQAIAAGASYVASGPCFSTKTKPNLKSRGVENLRRTVESSTVPVCAIGGITKSNLSEVLAAKPDYIAIVTAVSQTQDPLKAKEELLDILANS